MALGGAGRVQNHLVRYHERHWRLMWRHREIWHGLHWLLARAHHIDEALPWCNQFEQASQTAL